MVKLNAFRTQWRKNMKRKVELSFMYSLIWAPSSEFGTYRLCEQQGFRRACASAQNLRCSLMQAMSQEEPSDRRPDPWSFWMAGHAQLKFFKTECSKTQIRLTRPYACASVNNNNLLSEDLNMNESLFLWGKMFIFVVAYIKMINDVGNLT